MNRFPIVLLGLLISSTGLAAEGFSSIEEQMTGKEYTAAGLNKLTPAELESLNNWIREHSLATLATPRTSSTAASAGAATAGAATTDTRGLPPPKPSEMDRTEIQSRIVGKFSGWDGTNLFKLENGMIWKQDDKDKFYIKEIQNPVVTIKPGMFKSWHLSVEGYNSRCRVERIQ